MHLQDGWGRGRGAGGPAGEEGLTGLWVRGLPPPPVGPRGSRLTSPCIQGIQNYKGGLAMD